MFSDYDEALLPIDMPVTEDDEAVDHDPEHGYPEPDTYQDPMAVIHE